MMAALAEFNWTRGFIVGLILSLISEKVIDAIYQSAYVLNGEEITTAWVVMTYIASTIFICMVSVGYFYDQPKGFKPGIILGLLIVVLYTFEILFLDSVGRQLHLWRNEIEVSPTLFFVISVIVLTIGIFGWLLGLLEKRIR